MLCNANPKNKKKKQNKTKKAKKNCHKEQRDEAQGPCQKDLIRLRFLNLKPFR